MTPEKFPKTQEGVDKLLANVHGFWRDSYNDRVELMGPEFIAAEDKNIALYFSNADESIRKMAKEIEASTKRGKDGKEPK